MPPQPSGSGFGGLPRLLLLHPCIHPDAARIHTALTHTPALACSCCSLLYELFTSAAAVDKGAPLLIACNKMDAPGARTVDAVKAILEEEL